MKDKFSKAVEGSGIAIEGTGFAISSKNDEPRIGAGSGGISSSPFRDVKPDA